LDPRALAPLEPVNSPWLTFDPTTHLLTDTVPACGLYDPFNVYGKAALAGQPGYDGSRFLVDYSDVLRCIEADPEIKVFVTHWTLWFLKGHHITGLVQRYPDRVVFQDPRMERVFRERLAPRSTGGETPASDDSISN
jgi:hypothetical protein